MKEIQDQIFIKAGDLPGDGDFFFLPGDFPSLDVANATRRFSARQNMYLRAENFLKNR